MQLIRQSETSTVNYWPLQHDTNTVITLNNFMTSVYLPPEIIKEELYA